MARLDDLLTVHTHVKAMKNSSFVMEQVITCQDYDVFKMDVTIVCVDTSGRPERIPDELRKKFTDYIEGEE